MAEKTADLHIHSYYSDGTMSPEEILKEAIRNNVGLLAITDHDMLEGSLELKRLCSSRDILYISGVELDSLEDGVNYHILGYGVDLTSEDFHAFVKNNRYLLDMVNVKLIENMQKDISEVTLSDYLNFEYDKSKGGWKALHYLMEKGLTHSLREGFAIYDKYQVSNSSVAFPSIQTVCAMIHQAGGKAVLAHPGVSIKEPDIKVFKDKLLQLLDYGLDGIECYYVTHSDDITKVCLNICSEHNLLVTAGSDCHGAFGSAVVGDINIPISNLRLGELLTISTSDLQK